MRLCVRPLADFYVALMCEQNAIGAAYFFHVSLIWQFFLVIGKKVGKCVFLNENNFVLERINSYLVVFGRSEAKN